MVKKAGGRFVLDTSGAALRLGLQEGVYLVKPNLRELCELVGRDLPDEPLQAEAALQLVQTKQAEVVVLSLGAGGALVASATGTERLWAPSVRVKSKAGAGDSMLAGFVLGLARGKVLGSAARLGIAAGCAATLNPGTQLCTREDTERMLSNMM